MSSLPDQMIRRMLKRVPTTDDYQRMNDMLNELPDEMRSSPAVICSIVMQLEFLVRLERVIDKASWDAQQKLDAGLPTRIDTAAYRALERLRDTLPIDSHDAARRLYRNVIAGTIIAAVFAGTAGTIIGAKWVRSGLMSRQAHYDRDLQRCVDAASAELTNQIRNRVLPAPIAVGSMRLNLITCSSEYADRRAGRAE